jgi:hypothetical protein
VYPRNKREVFDQAYIRNFCPWNLDSFDYIPSVGPSGGMLVVWNGAKFTGQVIFQNEFVMSLEFTSSISNASWVLINVYAPCTSDGKQRFLNWFHNIDMSEEIDWLVVGDFNLMRKSENRNKPGGNLSEMKEFNAAISNQRLEELKLHWAKFIWTNKQLSPLLEHLDWSFVSVSWLTNYLRYFVNSLSRDTSDHTPCLISISTDVPKAKVFRLENYSLSHDDFMQVMEHGWNVPTSHTNNAKALTTKFKNLRRVLRAW